MTPSAQPKLMGSIGCVRTNAWHWLFSSTQIASALSAELRYRPHYLAQLLDETGVSGQLEADVAMALQAEELAVARYAGPGDAAPGRCRAHAPLHRVIGRLGVPGGVDQLGHAFVIDRAWIA